MKSVTPLLVLLLLLIGVAVWIVAIPQNRQKFLPRPKFVRLVDRSTAVTFAPGIDADPALAKALREHPANLTRLAVSKLPDDFTVQRWYCHVFDIRTVDGTTVVRTRLTPQVTSNRTSITIVFALLEEDFELHEGTLLLRDRRHLGLSWQGD